MASEFNIFVGLISGLITTLLTFLFDIFTILFNVLTSILAIALYAMYHVFPWKIYEFSIVYSEVKFGTKILPESWTRRDYSFMDIRDVACNELWYFFLDLFIYLPCFIATLLNPNEYYMVGLTWTKYKKVTATQASRSSSLFDEAKSTLCKGAFQSLFGWFSCLFIPFVFLNPYRLWIWINVLPRLWEERNFAIDRKRRELYVRADFPTVYMYELNLRQGLYSLADLFVITPTLLVVTCTPSLWYCFFGGMYECYKKEKEIEKYLTVLDNETYSITGHELSEVNGYICRKNINYLLYTFCFAQFTHAFIDIISVPLTAIALLSPLRNPALRSKRAEILAMEEQTVGKYFLNPLVKLGDNKTVGEIDFSTYRYSYESRVAGMTFGFLSLLDFFLLPFLLPLWLTWYRWAPVNESLRSVKVWSFNEVLIVMRQASYLAADVLILLFLLPVIYVTRYRWRPVQAALEFADGASMETTLRVHYMVIKTFLFMLFDLMTSPLLLLVSVTWYRSYPVWLYFSKEGYFQLNFAYHVQLMQECLNILHDVCIIAPILLVTTVLSPWRLPVIFSLVKYQVTTTCCAWVQPPPRDNNADGELFNVTVDVASGAETPTKDTTPLNDDNNDYYDLLHQSSYRKPSELVYEGDTCCCFSRAETSWRYHIYRLFFQIFIDWPILILSTVILGTVWRVGTTYTAIKKAIADTRYRYYYYYYDEFDQYMDLEWRAKWEVVKQFCLLLRDIFFLIPFSVIVATVYRLPFFLIDLLSRLAADPLPDANPLFEVVECKVESPEKGSPLISLQLLPTFMGNSPNNHKYNNKLKVSSAKLFVSGQDFWTTCSSSLGSSIVGIAKTFLPLKLVNDKSIGVTELNNLIIQEASILPLWIRLDALSKVKKSTILKKLRKLSFSAAMEVQLEGDVEYEAAGKKVCETKVLLRFKVTISDLITTLEASAPIPATGFAPFLPSVESNEGGLVDSFYAIVAMHFFLLVTDLQYILQLVVISLAPWRFFSLLYYLLEPVENNSSSIRSGLLQCVNDAGLHLVNYRREVALPCNEYLKQVLREAQEKNRYDLSLTLRNYWDIIDDFTNTKLKEQVKEVEQVELKAFVSLYKFMMKICQVYEDLTDFLPLLEARLKLYNEVLTLHFIKQSLLTHFSIECVKEQNKRLTDGMDVLNVLLSQRIIHTVKSLNDNKLAINKNINEHKAKRIEWSWQRLGVFKRSLNETRAIITYNFFEAINDLFYSIGALFVLFSVFKTLQFIEAVVDSVRKKGWNSYNFKQIVKHFVYVFLADTKIVLRFMGAFTQNLLLVFNFPSYLADLLVGFDSFRTGIDISNHHLDRAIYYCCDFVHLLCSLRTYRVLGRSILFAFLVPSACLAELFPRKPSTSGRFYMGLAVWIALFVATIVAFKRGVGAADVAGSNHTLLGISLVILFVLSFGLVSMLSRPYLTTPYVIASSRFSFTWSHVYALFTPILETIQLMAVILYFYWPVPTNEYEYTGNNDNIFASKVFLWGDDHASAKTMNDSVILACVVVMLNGVFTTIPLAMHHKAHRVTALKESPLYELVSVLFTRLFPVWIIATLMRASSCITSASSDSGVISTATSVHCDSHFWSSSASLPLLAYYMITSTILHSDDLRYLQSRTSVTSVTVKFSPLYASLVRIVQFITCMLCLSTFATPNSSLVLIIICNILTVIAPFIYGTEKSCSLASMTAFRSTGFVCVVWTAIVCIARQNSAEKDGSYSYGWATESALWIGCGVIILIGLVLTYYIQSLRSKLWNQLTDQTELNALINSMKSMHDELFVEEATFGTDKKERTDKSLVDLKWSARSPYELARNILNLERNIIADKLKQQFLSSRNEWKKKVISDVIPSYFRDWKPPVREVDGMEFLREMGINPQEGDGLEVLREMGLETPNMVAVEEGVSQGNKAANDVKSMELVQCLTLVDELQVLKENIRPRSAVNLFHTSILQILSYKLPVDVVRHIFTFFIDSSLIGLFLDEYVSLKLTNELNNALVHSTNKLCEHFPLLEHYFYHYKTFTERCYASFAVSGLTSQGLMLGLQYNESQYAREAIAFDSLRRACSGIDPRIITPFKFPLRSIVRISEEANSSASYERNRKYIIVDATYDANMRSNMYGLSLEVYKANATATKHVREAQLLAVEQ